MVLLVLTYVHPVVPSLIVLNYICDPSELNRTWTMWHSVIRFLHIAAHRHIVTGTTMPQLANIGEMYCLICVSLLDPFILAKARISDVFVLSNLQ